MAALFSSWRTFAEASSSAIANWARPAAHATAGPMAGYPLASGYAAFTIAFGYLLFVAVGSTVMKKVGKKVPNLYGFKFAYNICQIMLCSWMCIESGVQAWKHGYTLMPCEPFDQKAPVMGFVLYVFYLSKILDFADTLFIIAECRWNQLSFLHVYHHFSIFLFYWLNLNVGYDGDVFLTIVLNGAIHAIMYTYYFVSLHMTAGQGIWWKPFLTISQMVQFLFMNLQAAYLIMSDCQTFPPNIIKAYFYYIVSLLCLFMHFFIKDNFFKKKGDKDKKSGKDSSPDTPTRTTRSKAKAN